MSISRAACAGSILALAAVLAACAPSGQPAGSASPAPAASASAGAPPPTVTVVHPIVRTISEMLEFTGRTAAVETVEVRARVGGYLKEVAFHEGADVKKGDLLCTIDADPYKAALKQAEGTLASAVARFKTQELEVGRYQALVERGGISRQMFDAAVGARNETAATRQALQAAVDRAKLDLDYTRITAPISGSVSRVRVTPGNVVIANQTVLTTIVSLDPVYVYFDVDEATVLRARKLMREKRMKSYRDAKLPVFLALAGEEGYPHVGSVDFVENVLEPGTGTLNVRAVFPNKDRALSSGLFARVRFALGGPQPATLVPQQAISMDQRGEYLKLVKADGTVEERPVTTGRTEGSMVVVQRGLAPADTVIISGLQKARAGAKVAARLMETPAIASIKTPDATR